MSGAPVLPSRRDRECEGCGTWFTPAFPWHKLWRQGYCSEDCDKRTKRAEAPTPGPRRQIVTRSPAEPKRRRAISEASPEQREAVALKACVARREGPCDGPIDPAHLIPRGLCPDTDGDPRAVVPLCRRHHDAYDRERTLDLLPYLEPWHRDELAFAVWRVGLMATLRRVTNERQA